MLSPGGVASDGTRVAVAGAAPQALSRPPPAPARDRAVASLDARNVATQESILSVIDDYENLPRARRVATATALERAAERADAAVNTLRTVEPAAAVSALTGRSRSECPAVGKVGVPGTPRSGRRRLRTIPRHPAIAQRPNVMTSGQTAPPRVTHLSSRSFLAGVSSPPPRIPCLPSARRFYVWRRPTRLSTRFGAPFSAAVGHRASCCTLIPHGLSRMPAFHVLAGTGLPALRWIHARITGCRMKLPVVRL